MLRAEDKPRAKTTWEIKLISELAIDIMEEVGHTIDPTEATQLERREIERRIQPYLEQLPAYQDRLQRVFTREKD